MEWDKETVDHIKAHVTWPATGEQIMQQCNMMAYVPDYDRKMAMDKLDMNKTYNSADEAIRDLNR